MEDAFFFSDGSQATSVKELKHILESASPEVTESHVGDGRNDYAAWIRHSLNDDKLAHKVEQCTSVEEVVTVLDVHLMPAPKKFSMPKMTPKEEPKKEVHVEKKEVLAKEPHLERPEPAAKPKLHPAPTPAAIKHEEPPHAFAMREFFIGFVLGIIFAIIASQVAALF